MQNISSVSECAVLVHKSGQYVCYQQGYGFYLSVDLNQAYKIFGNMKVAIPSAKRVYKNNTGDKSRLKDKRLYYRISSDSSLCGFVDINTDKLIIQE